MATGAGRLEFNSRKGTGGAETNTELRQFLRNTTPQATEKAVHPGDRCRWKGMVYAARTWVEGMLGIVVGGELKASYEFEDADSRWFYQIGLKSQAALVPRAWLMLSENYAPAGDEPDFIVAVLEEMQTFRRAKALILAGYVRELLQCACALGGADEVVWVCLKRDDVTVTASQRQAGDALALVWVKEEIDVFQVPGDDETPSSEDISALNGTVAGVQRVVAGLHEEVRPLISQRQIGYMCKGLTMTHAFCGHMHAMDHLRLGIKQRAEAKVYPIKEWLRRACIGEQAVPLMVSGRKKFMLVLQTVLNLSARFKLLNVVKTLIREGAVGKNASELCLLCTEEFLFLSPLRFPTSCFYVIILEMPVEAMSLNGAAFWPPPIFWLLFEVVKGLWSCGAHHPLPFRQTLHGPKSGNMGRSLASSIWSKSPSPTLPVTSIPGAGGHTLANRPHVSASCCNVYSMSVTT